MRASDADVETWQKQGWVLIDGLLSTDEVDEAARDLPELFPTAEAFHADPDGVMEEWLGRPAPNRGWKWPDTGPGFRPEQHRWFKRFPLGGSGALDRLCVHPALVDFAERALGNRDLRIYQAGAAAKYSGLTNYEQPMHTDRNHSWLPPIARAPWWILQTFIYLSDVVDVASAPTHLVPLSDSAGRSPMVPLVMPQSDPDLYAAERPASGVRGSVLAYRTDVFHRGVDITAPGEGRFFLGVSFKGAGQDWIGFDGFQSRANEPVWDAFVAGSTPRELELFGFPPPGHPVWDEETLAATAERYPGLDLEPWRTAASGQKRPNPGRM